jgi:hypothetical protein
MEELERSRQEESIEPSEKGIETELALALRIAMVMAMGMGKISEGRPKLPLEVALSQPVHRSGVH